MSQLKNLSHILNSRTTFKRMSLGALIGLALISLLIFSVDHPDPAWGPYWRIRPLVITPLAAAFGMLSFYLRDIVRPQSDLKRGLVFLASLLGFVISLWLGTVLGLDGTLWN
ncbi:potassium transporter KefB [Robiginitalea sp. SC105]|uniref:potassium transporter KefB n=1 Tax=Robiginitalea sp. SC105 TaxID=2762332 RepID=UPI00163A7672|nr:potassium transporter KefB [Robiginitalea sp. SC105]MBC2839818.1 potassium transporter KefB [Robiginitalea sp. SC105]